MVNPIEPRVEHDRDRESVPTSSSGRMVVEFHTSIGLVDRTQWSALFPGTAEGYDMYRAFEAALPPDVSHGALTVKDVDRLVVAAPVFGIAYRVDTPFQGRLRQATDWLFQRVPRLLRFGVVGIGSPFSDNCNVGFAADLDTTGRRRRFSDLLVGLMAEAKRVRATILTVKSLGPEAVEFHDLLASAGYARMTSVPVVMLPLPYASLDHYFADLPRSTSAYLKRKLRGAEGIRIEYRDSTMGLDAKLNELYAATLAQSSVDYADFEKLHPDWFREVKDRLGERAQLMLCWRGAELLSFQLVLVGEKRLILCKLGMKYPEAREHNLYFVNFLKMIEYAIERGIPEIEMGATAYAAKLLFGGHLERRWIHFRCRNPILNRLAQSCAPLFDYERSDPELKVLRAKRPISIK